MNNQDFDPELISILTPTYNRHKFLPLYIMNLQTIDYPKELLEVVIDDDGADAFIKDLDAFKNAIAPIKVNYMRYKNRRSIGEKRNNLVKRSSQSHKVVVYMDDDDIYHPSYIRYSFNQLRLNKARLVGSNQMIFLYPEDNFKITGIRCEKKYQAHEATMMMTKRYHRSMGGFAKSSQGEGAKIIQDRDKDVFMTDIRYIMICVAHDGNTIDKDIFKDKDDINNEEVMKLPQVQVLKDILKI